MTVSSLSYRVSRNTSLSVVAVWLGVASAFVVLSVPLWGSPALMRWAVEVMCYLVLAQMWNLMAGYGGLMSVGMQAFVGVGAYSLFVFAQHLGIPSPAGGSPGGDVPGPATLVVESGVALEAGLRAAKERLLPRLGLSAMDPGTLNWQAKRYVPC